MRGLRFSLFSKIMVWFFLNLLLLGGIFLFIFNLNFRFDPRSPFFGEASNRIEAVSRLISSESQDLSREERDSVLQKYSEAYKAEFFIFDHNGKQIGGKERQLPTEVQAQLNRSAIPPPPFRRNANSNAPAGGGGEPMRGMPPGPPPMFVKTSNPTLYWLIARTFVFEKNNPEPIRATLLVVSDSPTGRGLFFDPTPWFVMAGIIVGVSILFWLPFVRSITKTITQMTGATEQIADEQFDIHVNEKRTDELGRLGAAINHLATRLSNFVTGQKRFLGDISHELNSPLARMQFALSILEERVDENNRAYVEDVKEEVQLMSKMVNELLDYSKAGIKTSEASLEKTNLHAIVKNAVEREKTDDANIKIEVDENVEAMTRPELLSRAVANLIRNAIRYAGKDGPITVLAEKDGEQVTLSVKDCGQGVPESEIEKLFDPFYRLEPDRARNTGGTGLGLAIVKTCVEACKGKVTAKNVTPHGLEVNILLKAV